MKIVEKYKIWFGASLLIMLVGLVVILTQGLNYGIDFTGGTMLQVELGKTVSVSEIENVLKPFDLKPDILHVGEEKTEVMIKTTKALETSKRDEVFAALANEYKLKPEAFISSEQFGPAVGEELQRNAFFAILIASAGMLIYITLRFQFVYGASAIIALLHDILILISVYAIFRIPVNSPFIAAILTVVGYSINDTIVVFDRIRETIKGKKKESYADIANTSIKSTLARSINTSFTTVIVISGLYVFGVESVKTFALPLIVGISVGTFSSIFIASPIWALVMDHQAKKDNHYSAPAK
jgi:preprotein translocase SecF subunit